METQSCDRQYGLFMQDTVKKQFINLEDIDLFPVVFCGCIYLTGKKYFKA